MMKRTSGRIAAIGVLGFSICTLSPVLAQPPGDQGNGGPQQGGPGFGGNQGGPGGRGQRGFGGPGGMPMANGTITGGDAAAQTIIISSQFGGGSQTIKLSSDARLMTQVTVSVKDLKIGDQVQVQGAPTGITASSIVAGETPSFLGGGRGGPGGPGGFGPGQGQPGGAGQPQGAAGAAPMSRSRSQASATALGKVVSTSPLTISISDEVSIVIKLAANAKITKYQPVAFSSLKVGDRVMASGQTGQDGIFTATGVGINIEMGRGGPGGFGGGPGGGPGGFGGPGGGGPGGGPGGQGGDGPPPPPGE